MAKADTPPPQVLAALAKLNDQLSEPGTQGMAGAAPDWPEALRVQMDAVLHDQAELLDEAQKMMAAWTKRRHEAMETGFRALEKLSGSRDLSEMAAAYSEWLTSSMGRIMEDMMAAQKGALRLADLGQTAVTALTPKGATGSPDSAGNKRSRPG